MIRLDGVHRHFKVGDQIVRALDGVDLQVDSGEYLSIMGPSGSGKSTLLNIIGLLDRVSEGSYHLDGVDVTGMSDRDLARQRLGKIGFVFQFFHLVPRLSAAQNVELPLMLSGMDPAERRSRVDDALLSLGLESRSHHRPDQLSGGQRQRVAIARAVVTQPAVVLADEPTGNLDRASGQEVVEILEALNTRGITLMIVTHDPALAGRAGRCIEFEDGRLVRDTGVSRD